MSNNGSSPLVLWYNQLGMNDVDRVGGKNASLGEMITNLSGMGVSVPNGFATTADAFNQFLDQSGVNQRIYALLDETDIDDVSALAKAGAQIRQWIIDTPFQSELENAIRDAYDLLSADDAEASFAVRSSATAEDMPDASFAGQQETFLNVQGFDAACFHLPPATVFASLFNDRAISYRVHQGYDHRGVALSAGVQRMVRSDLASSGVMFSIDTESGFDRWCLSPGVGFGRDGGRGAVNPDEFYVHKPTLAAGRPAIVRRTMGSKKIRMVYAPTQEHGKQVRIEDVPQAQRDIFSLSNEEVQELAKQAVQIEKHYGRPMDIEWAKDGHTGKLFIVQARPETVRSRGQVMERYTLHAQGQIIAEGRAIGHRINRSGQGDPRYQRDESHWSVRRTGYRHDRPGTGNRIGRKAQRLSPTAAGVPVTRRLSPREPGIQRWSAAAIRDRIPGKSECHRLLRRRRHRLCLRRAARLQRQELQRRRHAGSAAEGDDERRQPGSARSTFAFTCRTKRQSGAAGIYHQPHDWRSSARAAGV